MAGPDRPADARCPCTTKFAELTDEALVWFCDGCIEPLPIPYAVLGRGREAILEYLSGLPPRKKRFGSRRKKRPRK
jgi:hypothetical protein